MDIVWFMYLVIVNDNIYVYQVLMRNKKEKKKFNLIGDVGSPQKGLTSDP